MSTSAVVPLPQAHTKAATDARTGLRLGIGMVLTALVLLIFVQYALPPEAHAHYWGLIPRDCVSSDRTGVFHGFQL